MFTNMQRHVLRHIVLLCHWLQNCKLGRRRRLRCAFASPNPSAVVANSCTHRRRRRGTTNQFRLVGVGGVYGLYIQSMYCSVRQYGETANITMHGGWSAVAQLCALPGPSPHWSLTNGDTHA